MTEKLFYTDAYLKEFTATVLDCEPVDGKYAVRLDRTAFFPEEGGQYADRGTLNGVAVLDVKERGISRSEAHVRFTSVKRGHIGYGHLAPVTLHDEGGNGAFA